MAMLEIRNVQKTFRTYARPGLFHRPGARQAASELPVLRGVDLTVEKGDVVAILGPSGSGKREITEALCGSRGTGASERTESGEIFVRPVNYCTEPGRYGHKYVPEEAFDRMNFFEKTAYAGVRYGTRKEDIQTLLDQGKFAVIPVDMCGAIAMKRSFPTHIIYVARDKEKLIADIIDSDYDTEEKTLRILSIDAEKRNRKICDYVIHNDTIEGERVSGAEEIRRLILLEGEKY